MKKIVLFVILALSAAGAFAQMSDEQVVKLLQDARQQGKSQQEMLMMLMQQGVDQEQLMRIKEKYSSAFGTGDGSASAVKESRMRTKLPVQQEKPKASDKNKSKTVQPTPKMDMMSIPQPMTFLDSLSLGMEGTVQQEEPETKVFGRDVFGNQNLTFEPNINMATPETYILGPGDEVIIDIWGDAKQTLRQQISPDGTITDTEVGPIVLNGLSVKEANARLKSAYANIYSTMNGSRPTTFMTMSLGEIRSIQVNVVGEVTAPGTYTLPSLASLFHALYSAGGVSDIGSLRCIKISRGGKELAQVDVYAYLLDGRSDMDIQLKDGDVVIVPPYQNMVNLQGRVKRPMFYEMKDEETVKDILRYAGGFSGDAYKKAVGLLRKSGREYRVYNVEEADYAAFALTDGDEITVDSVINRFENRVEIKGAVFREGRYALKENVSTVKQLIEKSEGVRGDAFLARAVLYREKPDFTLEVVSVNVRGLLNGTEEDIELRNNDLLYIPSIFDLREEQTISISGAVGYPGEYKFAEDMGVEDVIVQAGGLKESASVVKVDVARRIKDPKSVTEPSMLAETFTLTLKDGLLVEGDKDFVLMPFDEIFVRNSPGYQVQQSVTIKGEALFAGDYVIAKKGERLSDLVRRAGGLTPDAYVEGARLERKMNEDERIRVETLLKLTKKEAKDTIDVNTLDIGDMYYVGIELAKALENPGSEYDVILREGDVLRVPEYVGTVKISGSVLYPNTVLYKKGRKLKYYIEQAGGYANRAKRRGAFVIYMNGKVSKGKSFDRSQNIAGCEIVVPMKPIRNANNLSTILSVATSATSMAAMVTSIINNTK